MQWVLAAVMLVFVAWAVWRGYEAYSFRKLISVLDGEITDASLRQVLDRLTTHNVPNARQYWEQLRSLEARVANSRGVTAGLKAEFKTLLDAKSSQY